MKAARNGPSIAFEIVPIFYGIDGFCRGAGFAKLQFCRRIQIGFCLNSDDIRNWIRKQNDTTVPFKCQQFNAQPNKGYHNREKPATAQCDTGSDPLVQILQEPKRFQKISDCFFFINLHKAFVVTSEWSPVSQLTSLGAAVPKICPKERFLAGVYLSRQRLQA